MSDDKDLEIEAALRGREVPEHGADFFTTLAASVDADIDDRKAQIQELRPTKRRPFFYALPVAAAILAVTAVAVGLTNGFGSSDPNSQIANPPVTGTSTSTPAVTEIRPILASEVAARATTALQNVSSISGTIETKTTPPTSDGIGSYTGITQFKKRANGDMWASLSEDGQPSSRASYTAATAEVREYDVKENTGRVQTGFVDAGNGSISYLVGLADIDQFAASIVGLSTKADSAVVETTFDNRPAWEIQVNGAFDLLGSGPDHWMVTVDQATSFPVRVYGTFKGKPYTDRVVKNLVVNQEFTDAEMHVDFPAGVTPEVQPGPYKAVPLANVESAVGYKPFIPTAVPDGFTLSNVFAAKDAGPGGPEGLNPDNKNVVMLQYRKGLQSFLISTRASATTNTYGWNDPLGYEGEPETTNDKIKLVGGAFDGVEADLRPESRAVPHLWAIGSRWLLTLSGNLERQELLDIAQSLQQQ